MEQRIGRCHRYGQKFDVVVINFLNKRNDADRRVLELLSEKFHLFDGFFGASDEILGRIESGLDFENRIAEIYQSCRETHEIEAAFNALHDATLSRALDENNQYFQREREKLDAWAQDQIVSVEANLEDTRAKLKEAKTSPD